MAGLRLVNVIDVARALGGAPMSADPKEVADWLRLNYLAVRPGGFNYNPASVAMQDLFAGKCKPADAERFCLENGPPAGRKSNAEAISAVSQYAFENISSCYNIGFSAIRIGRAFGESIYMGIKAPIARVRNRMAFIVIPGFRMSFRPSELQIDFICSVVRQNFSRNDLEVADVEYLYAGPGYQSKARSFRAIHGRDRALFSDDAVDHALQTYVTAVTAAAEAGADMRRPNLNGYKIIDPSDPSFL